MPERFARFLAIRNEILPATSCPFSRLWDLVPDSYSSKIPRFYAAFMLHAITHQRSGESCGYNSQEYSAALPDASMFRSTEQELTPDDLASWKLNGWCKWQNVHEQANIMMSLAYQTCLTIWGHWVQVSHCPPQDQLTKFEGNWVCVWLIVHHG